jgi:uncharacterized protein YyaL (SSP411 family)
MSSHGYLTRAKKLADWFVAGQIDRSSSADRGRYVNVLDVRGRKIGEPKYTSNWTTGMTCIAMLMAWKRTGEDVYLNSARIAGEYLKSLQIMDARNRKVFGMIREVTPQTDWCHPRDALSAAWALLHLGMLARDKDALARAKLFAEWFKANALRKRYPAWTCFADGRKPYWQLGSFHGGSPLYFFDLYTATHDKRWLRVGLGICDQWLKIFPKKDGSIRIEVDPTSGRDLTGKGDPGHVGWQFMHKYNDDFTSLALLRAYLLTWKNKYLDAVRRYMDWIIRQQQPRSGAFGKPTVNSAAASLIIELLDLHRITREKKYRQAADHSIDYFLSLQELKRKDRRVHGGFYGIAGAYSHGRRSSLNTRTGAYALAALLKLESRRKYLGYTA